jgi:hypothetical protein
MNNSRRQFSNQRTAMAADITKTKTRRDERKRLVLMPADRP